MLHVAVNMEDSSSYQTQTENFIAQHRFQPVLNDYLRSNNITYLDGFVRLQFQPANQRPVFVVINCVSNSPSHAQWQLLVNEGRYGETDFAQEMANWRAIIDSVQAPPPKIDPVRNNTGVFEFTVQSQGGRTNRVDCSADLRDWTTITNLFGTNALITIRDAVAPVGQRFYRVVRQ